MGPQTIFYINFSHLHVQLWIFTWLYTKGTNQQSQNMKKKIVKMAELLLNKKFNFTKYQL